MDTVSVGTIEMEEGEVGNERRDKVDSGEKLLKKVFIIVIIASNSGDMQRL